MVISLWVDSLSFCPASNLCRCSVRVSMQFVGRFEEIREEKKRDKEGFKKEEIGLEEEEALTVELRRHCNANIVD